MSGAGSAGAPAASEQAYIPGTLVIKNLVDRDDDHPYGTSDPRHLERAETFRVSRRLEELRRDPVDGFFTFSHMREIHKRLFQDVYAWAGEPRNVPMQKHGTSYAEPASEMPRLLREQYTGLAAQNRLRGITDREEFTQKLAGLWAEVNHSHSFREGNTRSQTVFFEQLAEHAGWTLDVARLSPRHPESVYQVFVDARFEHQRRRATGALSAQEAASDLAGVLHSLIEPDNSLEGRQRRGDATPPALPARVQARKDLHARHPELRDLKLDPQGLTDEHDQVAASGEEYQA